MSIFQQAWETILATYNASQTGGIKTLAEIQKKYKNMKCIAKKEMSENTKEMKKTGGGSASLSFSNAFDFSQKQIAGFENQFDSDNIIPLESNNSLVEQDIDEDDNTELLSNQGMPMNSTPKYNNKKMKMTSAKVDLIALKEQGIKLDIEGKILAIEKAKLDIEEKKLDIEIKKLDLESKKSISKEI